MSLPNLLVPNINQAFDASQPLSETVFLDTQLLSSQLVDNLAEAQRNWIGVLHSCWEVDLGSCNWPNAIQNQSGSAYLTIRDLIALTRQFPYNPVAIEQQIYWVYTICLRVVGLDRARLVFSFDDPQFTGECTVLATNRLDWSPRNVLTKGLQRSRSEHLEGKADYKHVLPFPSTTSGYNVA